MNDLFLYSWKQTYCLYALEEDLILITLDSRKWELKEMTEVEFLLIPGMKKQLLHFLVLLV